MNDYYTLALNEYAYYEHATKLSDFNNINAVHCQQICEKLLKSVVQTQYPDKSSLKTHNLRILYEKVKDIISIPMESEFYLSTLTDFYFDARYPGDDFCIVSDDHLSLCETTMQDVYKAVTEWHNSANNNSADLLNLAMDNDDVDIDKMIHNELSLEQLEGAVSVDSIRKLLPTAKLSKEDLVRSIRYAIELVKPK